MGRYLLELRAFAVCIGQGRVKKTEKALQESDDHHVDMRGYRISKSPVDVKNLFEE